MLKLFHILLLSLVFLGTPCCAKTIKTNDIHRIQTEINQANPETLVIFDVDDVLMTGKDQILQPVNHKFAEKLEEGLESRHSENEAQKLWSIIWLARLEKPVDPQMSPLIEALQEKGIRVLALTNAWTGPFGNISSLENWRVKELNSLGYHFEKSWPQLQTKVFMRLTTKDPQRFPTFIDGILLTCGVPKGEVLQAFLAYAGLAPQKIIFIDDKRKNLESVEKTAESLSIPFVGIEYTAVKDAKEEPLDKARAEFQFEVLEKEQKWLSDQEAEVRMKNNHGH
jgi:FMN phosphatase YigB (HAD superfamily)